MLERLVAAIAERAVRRPRLALALAIGSCLVLALPALGLRLDGDARRLLPDHDPTVARFLELGERYQASEQTVVVVSLPVGQAADPTARRQRDEAVDRIVMAIDALRWTPPTTAAAPRPMVTRLDGRHDPGLSLAIDDLLVAQTWLLLDDEGLTDLERRLDPARLARRLALGGRPDVAPHLIARDPLGLWADRYMPFWRARLGGDRPLHQEAGRLISRDGHAAVLILHPDRPAQDPDFTSVFAPALDGILSDLARDPAWSDLTFEAAGGHLIAAADYQTARSSALNTLWQGCLLVLLIFVFAWRSLRLVGFLVATLLPAAGAALGLARLFLGQDLSLVVAAFAVVLIGLGVDFTIHLATAAARRREEDPTLSPARAATQATIEIAPAILAGGLTSVAAFCSLGLSAFPGLRDLGLVAAIGLSLMMLQILVAGPAFLATTPIREAPGRRLATALGGSLMRHPWPWLLTGGGVLAAALALLCSAPSAVPFDSRASNLRPADDPLFARQVDLARRFGLGVDHLHVLVDGTDGEAVASALAALVQRLAPLAQGEEGTLATAWQGSDPGRVDGLADRAGPALLDTPAGLLRVEGIRQGILIEPRPLGPWTTAGPAIGDRITVRPAVVTPTPDIGTLDPLRQRTVLARLARSLDWVAIDAWRAGLDATTRHRWAPFLADLTAMQHRIASASPLLPGDFIATPLDSLVRSAWVVDDDGIHADLRLTMPDLGNGMNPADLCRLLDITANGGPGPVAGTAVSVTGVPLLTAYLTLGLRDDFARLGLWSALAITLVLIFQLRSVRATIAVLFSMTAAALLTQAALVAFGLSWNLINVAALPLIFGLGIDAAIHLVVALRRSRHQADGPVTAVAEVLPPLVLTTVTTVAGFASLLLHPYRGLQSLGAASIIGLVACLVVAAIALPALARVMPGRSHTPSHP